MCSSIQRTGSKYVHKNIIKFLFRRMQVIRKTCDEISDSLRTYNTVGISLQIPKSISKTIAERVVLAIQLLVRAIIMLQCRCI